VFNFLFFNFFFSYQPRPEIFSFGPISIRWYGLFLVLAVFLGLILAFFWSKKYKIYQEKFWALGFYLLVLGIFGARLYHVLSEFEYYKLRWWEIFFIWRGGLGFYGALFLGLIFLFFWAKKNRIPFFGILDATAPSLALAEVFVRLGNYFNQEIFAQVNHFLYQILVSLLIFLLLLFFSKFLAEKIKNGQKFSFGQVFALYLMINSFFRFFFEFLRVDYQPIIFDLRLGQIVSIVLFTSGLIILLKNQILKRWLKRSG
jgi:phosphatidylglycerol:prolipoprotein diacylglycerol transferase